MNTGIKVSLWGTFVEAVGMVFDIGHHVNIGLESPEGLLTPYHAIIFIGFAINFVGVMMTRFIHKTESALPKQ